MKVFFYYLGLFLQLLGISSVGLCFIYGISQGDYSKAQLIEFVGGAFIFYLGHFLRMPSRQN